MAAMKHFGWTVAWFCAISCLQVIGANPLTIQEAEELALQTEPGVQSLEAQRDASLDLSVAKQQLPDPKLQLGVLNFPVETFDFNQEPMSQFRFGLKQDFPSTESRDAASQHMQARAAELQHSITDRKRMIKFEVQRLWLGIYYKLHAQKLINASLDKLRELHEVTRSQYAVGLKNQTGLISLGLEIRRVEDELLATQEGIATLRANLSRWIESDAFRPFPLDDLEIDIPDLSTTLDERLLQNPVLRAAEARINMTESDMLLAKSKFKPDLSGELSYSLRSGNLPSGASKSDFLSVAIGLRLPLFPQNRQDRTLQASIKHNSAAKFQKAILLRELNSRLRMATERLVSVNKRVEQFRTSIVPQALEFADAAIVAYQSDVGEYKDVVDSQRTALDVQIELTELTVERLRIHAEINYLIGEDDVS